MHAKFDVLKQALLKFIFGQSGVVVRPRRVILSSLMSEKAVSDDPERPYKFGKFSRSAPTMVAPRELRTHSLEHNQYFFASYAIAYILNYLD